MKPVKKLTFASKDVHAIKARLRRHSLHTVCEEAHCPNLSECFSRGTATFLILGNICTRSCKFCNVKSLNNFERSAKGEPLNNFERFAKGETLNYLNHPLPSPDENEPESIARMVKELGLKHVVVTSVTRDDLPDEGANHFAATIRALKGDKGSGEKCSFSGGGQKCPDARRQQTREEAYLDGTLTKRVQLATTQMGIFHHPPHEILLRRRRLRMTRSVYS